MTTLDQLNRIFQKVLKNPDLVLSRELTASQVKRWDSLSHVSLIVAIEKKFHIQFSFLEIAEMKKVGDLVDLIETKVSNSSLLEDGTSY